MLFLRGKALYSFPWKDKLVWETPSLCWFHTFGSTISLVSAAWLPSGVAKMSGTFCDKGRKCENGPNLPLGSLEVFIMENQTQNSKCIMNKRLIVFWQERIKMLITKVQKKHKNITSMKLRPTVTRRRKLREVVRKRGKIPLYPYFHSYGSEL